MKLFSKIPFLVLFSVSFLNLSAQNLVPDSSIETPNCSYPIYYSTINRATPWYNPSTDSQATSDSYDTCNMYLLGIDTSAMNGIPPPFRSLLCRNFCFSIPKWS